MVVLLFQAADGGRVRGRRITKIWRVDPSRRGLETDLRASQRGEPLGLGLPSCGELMDPEVEKPGGLSRVMWDGQYSGQN